MLLAYVDESYDKDAYWIVAAVCHEESAIPLMNNLDAVVRKAADAYAGISPIAELHGHALFHAKDDWKPLELMPRARIGVYNDAFDAIASHDVKILIRGVDVRRLHKRYPLPNHPHTIVLSHLLERIDEHAEREGERVLVIADEIDTADDHRHNLWRFQRFSTAGYRPRQLCRIVDTIHFAPSRASRLVQTADLVAYLHRRIKSGPERDDRASRANAALWARVQPSVEHCHCWCP